MNNHNLKGKSVSVLPLLDFGLDRVLIVRVNLMLQQLDLVYIRLRIVMEREIV